MTIKQIRNHRWFRNNSQTKSKTNFAKRVCYGFSSQPTTSTSALSQTVDCLDRMQLDDDYSHRMNSFSQPLNIDNMFLSTQTQMEFDPDSQGSSATHPGKRLYFRVVRRMTRFMANRNFDQTVAILERTFKDLNYSFKKYCPGQVRILIFLLKS